jgi:hypothetical protein
MLTPLLQLAAYAGHRDHTRREIARTAQALHVAAPQAPDWPPVDEYFTARPQLNVNWDDLRRKISAEWHETLDFLAE